MESEPSEAIAAATRRELITLLQQFEQATDAHERARILGRLEEEFTAEGSARVRARFENWLLGLSPEDLPATAAYARFTALLPHVLTGTLDPGSDEYADFVGFVAESDLGIEEYQDLQDTLEAGYDEWSRGTSPPSFDDPDISFLRSPQS